MLCCVSCLPSPHTPIHKGIHKGGREAPPLCGGGRRPPPLWMGVWGWGGSRHNKISINICKVYILAPP